MKRNDGDLPGPLEGLADQPITRARAIKLAGAMVGTGAFALLLPDEADALTRRQRRRRRRRRRRARLRRQRNVTTNTENSTIDFGDVTALPDSETVTVTNNGDVPVTVRPVVGDGFTLLDADGNEIADGDTIRIPANDSVDLVLRLDELVSSGTLQLVDVRDGLVLETVDLVADVTALL